MHGVAGSLLQHRGEKAERAWGDGDITLGSRLQQTASACRWGTVRVQRVFWVETGAQGRGPQSFRSAGNGNPDYSR